LTVCSVLFLINHVLRPVHGKFVHCITSSRFPARQSVLCYLFSRIPLKSYQFHPYHYFLWHPKFSLGRQSSSSSACSARQPQSVLQLAIWPVLLIRPIHCLMASLLLGNSGPSLTCGLVCPLPGDPARLQMICPLLGSRLRPLPTEPLCALSCLTI
jgi:hypothetical protein